MAVDQDESVERSARRRAEERMPIEKRRWRTSNSWTGRCLGACASVGTGCDRETLRVRSSCRARLSLAAMRFDRTCNGSLPFRSRRVDVSARLREQATERCIRAILWTRELARNDLFSFHLRREARLASSRLPPPSTCVVHLASQACRCDASTAAPRACVPASPLVGSFAPTPATPPTCVVKSRVHNAWVVGRGEDSPTLPTVDVDRRWMDGWTRAHTRVAYHTHDVRVGRGQRRGRS